jgi:hypothetical protein
LLILAHHVKRPTIWLNHLTVHKKDLYHTSLFLWFLTLVLFVGFNGFSLAFLAATLHFLSLFLLESFGTHLVQEENERAEEEYESLKNDRASFKREFEERDTRPHTIRECLLILGLDTNTTDMQVIKKQYRKLAKMHHPDMPEGDPERFIEIQYAYDRLEENLTP